MSIFSSIQTLPPGNTHLQDTQPRRSDDTSTSRSLSRKHSERSLIATLGFLRAARILVRRRHGSAGGRRGVGRAPRGFRVQRLGRHPLALLPNLTGKETPTVTPFAFSAPPTTKPHPVGAAGCPQSLSATKALWPHTRRPRREGRCRAAAREGTRWPVTAQTPEQPRQLNVVPSSVLPSLRACEAPGPRDCRTGPTPGALSVSGESASCFSEMQNVAHLNPDSNSETAGKLYVQFLKSKERERERRARGGREGKEGWRGTGGGSNTAAPEGTFHGEGAVSPAPPGTEATGHVASEHLRWGQCNRGSEF